VFSGDGMKVLPDRSDYFIMATFSLNLPLSVVMTRMYIPFDALLRSIVVAPFIPVPYCRDRVLFFSMQDDFTAEGVSFCKQLIFNA
jgi:hypothetical protein